MNGTMFSSGRRHIGRSLVGKFPYRKVPCYHLARDELGNPAHTIDASGIDFALCTAGSPRRETRTPRPRTEWPVVHS